MDNRIKVGLSVPKKMKLDLYKIAIDNDISMSDVLNRYLAEEVEIFTNNLSSEFIIDNENNLQNTFNINFLMPEEIWNKVLEQSCAQLRSGKAQVKYLLYSAYYKILQKKLKEN
jgi:hypothetical protein